MLAWKAINFPANLGPTHPPSMSTRVFYLELRTPDQFVSPTPVLPLSLELLDPPQPIKNREFYHLVGEKWEWSDRRTWSEQEWYDYAHHPELNTWLGVHEGEAIGYCEARWGNSGREVDEGDLEIVYFGLLPQHVNRGLRKSLLHHVVSACWALPHTRRIWLHTCTKDHPNALPNYQKRGFELYRTEIEGEA